MDHAYSVQEIKQILNKHPKATTFTLTTDVVGLSGLPDSFTIKRVLPPAPKRRADGVDVGKEWPVPIIYHTNDYTFSLCSKTKTNGLDHPRYHGNPELWGNVITNKATRTDTKFAIYVAPHGDKMHNINKDTFTQLFAHHRHVTITPAVPGEVQVVLNHATVLDVQQVAALITALKGNEHFSRALLTCK